MRRNADFTWAIVLALLITGIGTLRNERLCIRATGPSRQSVKAKSKNGTATANGRLNNEPRCNHGAAPRKGASPTRYDYNVFRRLRVSIRSLISFLGRRLFELRRRSNALIISPGLISVLLVNISVRNNIPETFMFSSVAFSFNFLYFNRLIIWRYLVQAQAGPRFYYSDLRFGVGRCFFVTA